MTVVLQPSESEVQSPWQTTDFVAPVPTSETTTSPQSRRKRQKLWAAVALIVLAAWIISSFWLSVQTRSPRGPFVVPTASQKWVKSPEAGPRAFFRLQFPIATTLPQSVTLWVEGFQQVTTFVDGTRVALAATAPNVLVDTAPDVPKGVQTIDIRPNLTPGINAVGLEVASLDGQAPAFRARVEVRTGTQVQDFGVSPSSWESTTNAALTGQVLPASGVFSRTKFDDGNWVPGDHIPRPGPVPPPQSCRLTPTQHPPMLPLLPAHSVPEA